MSEIKGVDEDSYEEVMLIKTGRDLDAFMEAYDVSTITKEY